MHCESSQADPGLHWRIQGEGAGMRSPQSEIEKEDLDSVDSDIEVLRDSRFSLNQSLKSPDD